MAVKDFTYAELLLEIKEEFGFDDTKDAFVQRRLNRAMHMLSRKRAAWHFLLRPYSIDIAGSNAGVADFTNGSAALANASALPFGAVRDIIQEGTVTGDLTSGYLVLDDTAAPARTLDAQFIGTTGLAKAATSTTAYHALPDDFAKAYMLTDAAEPLERVRYKDPYKLEELRLRGLSRGSIRRYYTVVSDPLPSSHANSVKAPFLLVYPYPASQTTLRGLYFFDFQNMAVTADISFIPRKNRPVIVSAAAWLISTSIGDSRVDEFKAQTISELEEMGSESSFADDDEETGSVLGRFLESDGMDTPDGPGLMPSFNEDW